MPIRILAVMCMFAMSFIKVAFGDNKLGMSDHASHEGRTVKTNQGYMIPYVAKIPGTNVSFEMMPIPGGKFSLGSPDNERHHEADEGPIREIEIAPFWMSKFELTWAEYKEFMCIHYLSKNLAIKKIRNVPKDSNVHAVSLPSELYDNTIIFGKGETPQNPALGMSHYAAKQYTKWLSGISDQFYRLPTEAEWEYACRAGSQSAYYFGNEAKQLTQYAWYFENTEGQTRTVGLKKPNPWGLYDMHGNVAEWTLDSYSAVHYAQLKIIGNTTDTALRKIAADDKQAYFPGVIRGGSYDDRPANCRSAARTPAKDSDWLEDDPNFPPSPWWFTNDYGLCVGIRILRPLTVPATQEKREKYWQADLEITQKNANIKIDDEGSGSRVIPEPKLIQDIQKLKALEKE
jgi:formylglycine-generating enzyme